MTAHRRPPMLSPWPGKGSCQWCGDEITSGRPDRGWHDGRDDEPDCLWAYRVAAFSADQRRAVQGRDKGICKDCGRDCEADNYAWQADHHYPLWLVDRTKPRGEILKYWSLENLVTRCDDCHKAKSAEEAAARAKMKRIRGETKRGPKKQIAHRGFDTRLRKKINGETVPREGRAQMA